MVARFAWRLYGGGGTWITTLALASSPLVLAFARIAIFDAMTSFFMVWALVSFYRAVEGEATESAPGRLRRVLLSPAALAWLAMALGVLTKGPVAFASPLLVALPYALWRRRPGALWSTPGVAAFVVLVGSWTAYVASRVPGYFEYVFVSETGNRLTTTDLGNSGSTWSVVPALVGGALPWSLVALAAWIAVLWVERVGRTGSERRKLSAGADPSVLYLLLWLAMPIVFFALSHPKRLQYLLPAMPAIALLLAAASVRRPLPPAALRLAAGVLIVLGAALVVAGTGVWDVLARLDDGLAGVGRRTALALGVLFLLAPGIAAWLARARPMAALVALALFGVLMSLVILPMLVRVAELRSSAGLARVILRDCPAAPVVGIDVLPTSLPFYLGHPVGLASASGSPFPSTHVKEGWNELAANGSGEPLFTLAWWRDLPQRSVIVIERDAQAEVLGAGEHGYALLGVDRRHAAYGRGCRGS